MAAVQQHTPSSESRRSKAFIDSMEEEMRRCSEHLERRQSKRSIRTLNGYRRSPDDFNGGEEAGAGRRSASSTLPRSFTMPSNPETRDLSFSKHRTHSPSNRSPRTPTMKAPIGATTFHDSVFNSEPSRTPEYRGRSAPPDSQYGYYSSSSGSEPSFSSRESSLTPVGMASRNSSSSPRSSLSPPPIAPKPSNGRSREKAWSNVRRNKSAEESPKTIRALPETSPSPQTTIPVSNHPINLSVGPMEFPSAEISSTSVFGEFGEVVSPHTPSLASNHSSPITDAPQSTLNHEATTETVTMDMALNNDTATVETTRSCETPTNEPWPVLSVPITARGNETNLDGEAVNTENTVKETPAIELTDKEPQETMATKPEEAAPKQTVSKEFVSEESELELPNVTEEQVLSDDQSLAKLSAPEVKSISKKIRHRSLSKDSPSKSGSPGRRRHSRTNSESKIHITVSSSKMGEVVGSTKEKKSDGVKSIDEKVASMLKDVQTKLREKDEEIKKLKELNEKTLHEKNEQIKKQAKDNKKVEREKWDLLKRAREAAERALHLRTQLDLKEGSIRGIQSELNRTKDELFSVKSANTSLRALLSELRAPHKTGVEVGVQADIGGGTLKRNKSIELAFTDGGLSQDQQPTVPERTPDFRTSTTSLGIHWPERSFSDKWDREESTSLCEGVHLPMGVSSSQPVVPWPEQRKGKRKKAGLLGGRLRRSTGSKRGSVTSVDGLDMSNSSILAGAGLRGTTPVSFPYNRVPSDLREQWKVLEQAKSMPFQDWTLQQVMAWIETGLGMIQYGDAVRDKTPSGSALLALTDSEMEKKLGISHPLHRRKLRLAIEEQRLPESCQYPHAGKIEHSWVAFEWAHDCGLAHLTEVLTTCLVDGRLLNTLTKEDIRKHLKITKKTDQMSFLSAVELLRMHEFNRQAIQEHRRTTNNPLYWTNRDVCDWLRRVQLEEYASNVIGGGVHGALLFLERGHFTSENLATILQIPSNKGHLRRHLAGKLARLFSEDVSQSVESLPSHIAMASSPSRVGSQGSQSPDRRPLHSPRHTSGTPPPAGDCPHPSRKNSLTRRAMLESLSQPPASAPRHFGRTSSGPSPQSRVSHVAAAERVRLSLRESALRSVSSIHEESPPTGRSEVPTPRSFTPTLANSSGTTV